MIGAKDNHLPSLDDPHYTKPSRWWQPPRVANPVAKHNHQVPLDAITQSNALECSQISLDDDPIKQGELESVGYAQ
jgi:hypothetical protein